MRHAFTSVVFWVLASACLHAGAAPAHVQPAPAQNKASTQVVKAQLPSKKKKKAQAKPAAEPVQYAPSGEAMPARHKRLLRECKGRPNAGACLGYAS